MPCGTDSINKATLFINTMRYLVNFLIKAQHILLLAVNLC